MRVYLKESPKNHSSNDMSIMRNNRWFDWINCTVGIQRGKWTKFRIRNSTNFSLKINPLNQLLVLHNCFTTISLRTHLFRLSSPCRFVGLLPESHLAIKVKVNCQHFSFFSKTDSLLVGNPNIGAPKWEQPTKPRPASRHC